MIYFNHSPESISSLSDFGRQILNSWAPTVQMQTNFVRPYCVAYLEQQFRLIQEVRPLRLHSLTPAVNQYLLQCGFSYLDTNAELAKPCSNGLIIPLATFQGSLLDVESAVITWARTHIMGLLPPLTPLLGKNIIKNLWEIVNNALVHGNGSSGVSACGQFYPKKRYMEVAFYDAGRGIPTLLRDFDPASINLSDAQCIQWAMAEGHTTRPLQKSGGMGLFFLKKFLALNGGMFQIASGGGYYGQDGSNAPNSVKMGSMLSGTLVNIRVMIDERQYGLKGERS